MTKEETQAQTRNTIREIMDAQLKLYGSLHEKAVAYTALLIGSGFAAFFGLWSATRSYLTKNESLLAALLVLVSLGTFVAFEIYKSFVTSLAHQRRARVMFDPDTASAPDVSTFLAKIDALEMANVRNALRLSRFWPWVWGITVVFGFSGAAVLFAAFARHLINE